MYTIDSLFTQHGYIIEIKVDRTSAPKFAFEIFKYEHFGNYEQIAIKNWYLYRTWQEAFNAAIEELTNLNLI